MLLSFLVTSSLVVVAPLSAAHDPCDSYGNCVSSSVIYIRANPDQTLYLGDSFSVPLSITTGQNSTGYSVSWSYDSSVFGRSGDTFTVTGNRTGTFSIAASVAFANSSLTTSQSVTVAQLVISLHTELVNITGSQGLLERNFDGSFYHNDSFCDSWSATFRFAAERTDIKINVTSFSPSLRVLNYSTDSLGRAGWFCYVVRTDSAYEPHNVTLVARALNWQGVSLALKESLQPFAVVRYDPQFTAYAYMEFRNSTAPSSLERPWVLFVRYDGNNPGYSYAGDTNTLPFNGSETLQERAYFDSFTFTSLSYQPINATGVFTYRLVNSTGSLSYRWLNVNTSTVLEGRMRIEKYVFEVEPSSLTPLLGQGFVYQNVTMTGWWTQQTGYTLSKNYWLVPFLWSGRVNVVSVGANGETLPHTPISVTIQNPSPLDRWLTSIFEHVFGDDPQALRAFQEDLYPTNQIMTFTGKGTLSLLLNQTSLSPPWISISAGGASLGGNFTFVPAYVSSKIVSVPNSLNGTIFYASATIPLWSYNMAQGSLAFLTTSTTVDQPTTFTELINSSGWIAGDTTAPQTPSAFASQGYGFWPMGENLTVYVNTEGGGIGFLGTQGLGPGEYQASFNILPWSGGMSSVQLIEGGHVVENESALSATAYPSPLPGGLSGLFSITYPATGQDAKAVFTNIWGARTTIDLGTPTPPAPLTSLIPETTVAAFGIAGVVWLVVDGILRTRKAGSHY